jgi:OmpA-OmpF porin, OOP family
MSRDLVKALVLLCATLGARAVHADGFDGQRLVSPMGAAGGFSLERPWILKHLGLGGGFVTHYGYSPVVERERPSGRILAVPLRHALTMDLLFAIGLGGFVELAAHLPVHAYFAGDATNFGGQPILANSGVGDLRLGPKFIFYRTGKRTFHWSIGMAIPVSFPTGDAAALRGSGGFVLDPRLMFGVGGWRWELYVNGGYRWRSNDGPANLYGFGEITYGVGVIVTLPVWKDRIDLAGELVGGYNHSGVGSELVKSPLETLLGIIIRPHPIVSVYAGGGAGLTSGLGTADARAFAGVRIAWRLQNRNDFADDDKDGVANSDDRCPRAAEDRDGFQDDDGCPEDDNDRDGISDDDDECPDQPEEPGGDRDGCPEKTYVTVKRGRLYIFGKVQFETDSTRITAKSQPLLDQIAVALRGHPELSDVRVQGHTDNVGGRDYNEKLSRERAEAVKAALMRRGVAEGRLHARGLGETRPIASNQTKGGRAKNRRVEFLTRD